MKNGKACARWPKEQREPEGERQVVQGCIEVSNIAYSSCQEIDLLKDAKSRTNSKRTVLSTRLKVCLPLTYASKCCSHSDEPEGKQDSLTPL